MNISFDPAKRQATLEERGLDFADALTLFEGPELTALDDRKDYGEDRFITYGYLHGRAVILVWTPRDDGRRIIWVDPGRFQIWLNFGSVGRLFVLAPARSPSPAGRNRTGPSSK